MHSETLINILDNTKMDVLLNNITKSFISLRGTLVQNIITVKILKVELTYRL